MGDYYPLLHDRSATVAVDFFFSFGCYFRYHRAADDGDGDGDTSEARSSAVLISEGRRV